MVPDANNSHSVSILQLYCKLVLREGISIRSQLDVHHNIHTIRTVFINHWLDDGHDVDALCILYINVSFETAV